MEDWGDYASLEGDMLTKLQKEFEAHRRPSFAEKEFNIAMEKYKHAMYEYKNLNWFVRLFKEKPIKPNIQWFVTY